MNAFMFIAWHTVCVWFVVSCVCFFSSLSNTSLWWWCMWATRSKHKTIAHLHTINMCTFSSCHHASCLICWFFCCCLSLILLTLVFFCCSFSHSTLNGKDNNSNSNNKILKFKLEMATITFISVVFNIAFSTHYD